MILLTGATGNVGRAAAHALLAEGEAFRVLVRDANRLDASIASGADVMVGDLESTDAVDRALGGVEKALLVTPNGVRQVDVESAFVDAAVRAQVQHLVKVSSMEAAPTAKSAIPRSHYQVEERIRASGMRWSFLRPSFFMQNLLMQAAAIRGSGAFTLPLGDAQTALVDARDVGRAAAALLMSDGEDSASYELTGPTLMNFDDVAAALGTAIGRPIRYQRQSLEEFGAALSQFIPSPAQVDALVDLFAEIAAGALARRSADYRNITGAEPTDIGTFANEHVAVFAN